MAKHIYTKEDIKYITDNVGKLSSKVMGEHLNVNEKTLRAYITRLRKNRTDITYTKRDVPIGHITERTINGRPVLFKKTEKGWRRANPKVRESKPEKIPREKPLKLEKTRYPRIGKAKAKPKTGHKAKNDAKFIEDMLRKPVIKIPDNNGKVPVRVNNKTIVLCKPGTEEQAAERYYKRFE